MNNRVWVYLSSKAFTPGLEAKIKADVQHFLDEWNAHGTSLESSFDILHNHFIVIRADEERFAASGCSIDKQLRFIKEVEQKYDLELLNRLLVAYKTSEGVNVVHASKIPSLLSSGAVNENTVVYNVGIANDSEFNSKFEIPLKESWLSKYLQPVK